MDIISLALGVAGTILTQKGIKMVKEKKTAKKVTKKAEPATVVATAGLVKTDFGTFQVDAKGDIVQLAPYPKNVDAIAGLTAEEVANKIRTQSGA